MEKLEYEKGTAPVREGVELVSEKIVVHPSSGALEAPKGDVRDADLWRTLRAEIAKRANDPKRAWSLSTLRKLTGLSTSALSKWLNGVPKGNVAKQEDILRGFLNRERASVLCPPVPTDIVDLKLADALHAALDTVWFGGWFGLITVPHGCGTTVALSRFVKARGTPVLIRPDSQRKSLYDCTSLAYEALTNRDKTRSKWKARRDYVAEHLHGDEAKPEQGRLVIVDNAEILDASGLRYWRDLHERKHLSVVLVAKRLLIDRLSDLEDVAYSVMPHIALAPVHKLSKGEFVWFSEAEVENFVRRFVSAPPKALLAKANEIANADGHLKLLRFFLRFYQFYTAKGKSLTDAMTFARNNLLKAA